MWWFYGPIRWNFWFIPPIMWFLFVFIIAFVFYQLLKRRYPKWTQAEIEALKMEIKSIKEEIEEIKRLGGSHGTR